MLAESLFKTAFYFYNFIYKPTHSTIQTFVPNPLFTVKYIKKINKIKIKTIQKLNRKTKGVSQTRKLSYNKQVSQFMVFTINCSQIFTKVKIQKNHGVHKDSKRFANYGVQKI